jgi:riboflavin biosynthesis pyrimidine reductase
MSSVTNILLLLGSLGVNKLLIEGGPMLWTSFFAAGQIDGFYWCVAPLLLGGNARSALEALPYARLADVPHYSLRSQNCLDQDIVLYYEMARL